MPDGTIISPDGTTKGGGAVVDPDLPPQAVDVQVNDPSGGIVRDAYWPRSALAWLVLSIILVLLSVNLVSPTRRWRPRLGVGGRAGLTVGPAWGASASAGAVTADARPTPFPGPVRPRTRRASAIRHRLRRPARDIRPVVAATHPPATDGPALRPGGSLRARAARPGRVGRCSGRATILAIRSALAPFRRRLWLRRSVRRAWRVLAAVLIAEAVLWTIARIVPFERAPWVALALPIVGLLLLAVLVLRARPSIGEAALAVDAEAGLARPRVERPRAGALLPRHDTRAPMRRPRTRGPAAGRLRRAAASWIPSFAMRSSGASGPMLCAPCGRPRSTCSVRAGPVRRP